MTQRTKPINLHPILEQLREVRITSGMSKLELSKRIGYTYSHICYSEVGMRIPNFHYVCDLANVLGYELRLCALSEPTK